MLQYLCTTDKLEEEKGKPLLKLLNDFGGWPILLDEYTEGKLHWVDLMSTLRLYNNDVLISMWTSIDGENSNSIFQVSLCFS